MTEPQVTTKARLLVDIQRAWLALNAALNRLTPAQMTTRTDAQGWTVKDHLMHLAVWERSAVFFLQGRPRHVGLGVEEALYLNGSDDEINAAIFQQHKDLPRGQALAQLQDGHQQLLRLLEPLSDADPHKSYHQYLPDEPGDDNGPSAMSLIAGNSAEHFTEHLGWIAALVGETASPAT